MTGQKFIAFFFFMHLLYKEKKVTPGSVFESKREDATMKLLLLLCINMCCDQEIFAAT